MTERQAIETTYADLRPDDLVIDKTGKAWPVDEVGQEKNLDDSIAAVTFWLCDPVTKANMHFMAKNHYDKVTVSRIPKQADEAAKLEADFPKSTTLDESPSAAQTAKDAGSVESDLRDVGIDEVDIADAVAGVEKILGGTVEAEVTAEEVDAANASTEDKPNQLPPFESMTILEMRSHLYLLHGVYAHDMKSRDETIAMHTRAHTEHAAGRLQTPAHIPHNHDGEALK